MNLGIYKPGQGYWIRVMSAVLLGLFTIGLSLWLYGQMLIVADRLPKVSYRVGLETAQAGAFKAGDAVELVTRADSTGAVTKVGTATVSEMPEPKVVTLRDLKIEPKLAPSAAGIIRKPSADATAPAQGINIAKNSVIGDAPIDPTILGGSVAAATILLGAIVGYWLIGLRIATVEFLIATDFEMKKVNWSSPREVMGHTWVVIGACVLLASTLFLVDLTLRNGFAFIGLLPK